MAETPAQKKARLKAERLARIATAHAAGFATVKAYQADQDAKYLANARDAQQTTATTRGRTTATTRSGPTVTTKAKAPRVTPTTKPSVVAPTPGGTDPVSGLPLKGSVADTRTPVGYPKGTVFPQRELPVGANRPRSGVPTSTDALYFDGDVQNIISDLYGTDEFLTLQAQLKAAGFIPASTKVSAGDWDTATTTGLEKVLTQANHLGVDYHTLLDTGLDAAAIDKLLSDGSGGGGGGGGAATVMPDPEKLRQAIDSTGQELLGRNLDPTTREQVLAEVNSGYAAAAASGAESFDLDAEIRKLITSRYGEERNSHTALGFLDLFAGMLGAGGGFGSAPSYGQSRAPVATGAPTSPAPSGSSATVNTSIAGVK